MITPRALDVSPIKVLLVEDNAGDARLMREMLADSDTTQFDVTHVNRLDEGLRQLESSDFNLMLLDLWLPDGEGLDTVARALAAVSNAPIVVMTSHDDEALAVKAVQSGAQDYLVKGQADTRGLVRTIRHAVERHRMLSQLKRARRREHHQATHDSLTGLPNRQLLYDRLFHALAYSSRHRESFAVLFIDIDHFKNVNDTRGHAAGDKLLTAAAERLSACLRKTDTAARLGGDEFVVILTDLIRIQDAARVAQNTLRALAKPYILGTTELLVTASIGIAIYPTDGEDQDRLIKNADTAMYKAKEEGGNNYRFYTLSANARAFERLALEDSLREALESGQFEVFYQPQVDVVSWQVAGVEALLRWRHPNLGLVLPGQFIPLAEETGLIAPLGEWVLRETCKQIKAWQLAGLPGIRAAVNLSYHQLKRKGLAKTVAGILRETNLDPEHIALEITESSIAQDAETAIATLRALKNLGLRIFVDDFGTGYSSLALLKRFPPDGLKIDQSFICDVTTNPCDASIVTALVAMAKGMNLEIVAEGVETPEQLEFLRSRQCRLMQGYLFSKPLAAQGLEGLMLKRSDA
jgi:diguanylate cyclase (GGDEF)-like protein